MRASFTEELACPVQGSCWPGAAQVSPGRSSCPHPLPPGSSMEITSNTSVCVPELESLGPSSSSVGAKAAIHVGKSQVCLLKGLKVKLQLYKKKIKSFITLEGGRPFTADLKNKEVIKI